MVKDTYTFVKDIIKEYIINNEIYNKKFNHFNQKHKLDDLILAVLYILRKNIPYRDVSKYVNIYWNTVYKFNIKMINLGIYKEIFNNYVNKYINELDNKINVLYTDTTLILNKLGEDMVTHNPQLKKHKTCKISIIMDEFKTPLHVKICSSNMHDSTIFKEQLKELEECNKNIITNNTKIIGDCAYDSNEIQNIITNMGNGKLITPPNIRNTKDKQKIKKRYNNLKDKILLKQRTGVEHLINKYKKFRRVYIRYDKYVKNYNSYVYLASLIILLKNLYC
jgi:hypothetical protein